MINNIVKIEYTTKSDLIKNLVEINTFKADGQFTKQTVPANYDWLLPTPDYVTEFWNIKDSGAYEQLCTNGIFWDFVLAPTHYITYGQLPTGNKLNLYELTAIRCQFEAGYWGDVHAGVKIRNAAHLQNKVGGRVVARYTTNGNVWIATALATEGTMLLDVMTRDEYLDLLGEDDDVQL